MECLLDAVTGGVRLRGTRQRHDEDELLPTSPDEHVDATNGLAHAVGEHAEHGIPGGVSVVVVDRLEVIEIHVEHTHIASGAARAFHLLRQPWLEVAMIERHRDVVEHREAPQSRSLDRRRGAVRQEAKQQLVLLGEGIVGGRGHREHTDHLAARPQRFRDDGPDVERLPLRLDPARVVLDVPDASRLPVLYHPAEDALAPLEVHGAVFFAGTGARARQQGGTRRVEEPDGGMVGMQELERRLGHGLQKLFERAVVRELSRQLEKDIEGALGAEDHANATVCLASLTKRQHHARPDLRRLCPVEASSLPWRCRRARGTAKGAVMGTRPQHEWRRQAPCPPALPGALQPSDSIAIRHLAFLAEVSRLLGTSLDYERTINESVHALVPGFADVCSVFVDESGQRVRVAEAGLDAPSEGVMHELRRLPVPPVLTALLDDALGTGHACLVGDYRALVRRHAPPGDPYREATDTLGTTTAIIAPIFVRGEPSGALTLGMLERTERRFDRVDVSFAEELAHRVGLAIDNARLYATAEAARRAVEQREAALVEERRTFETLYRIGTSLATELDEQKLIQRVTDEATAMTGASFGVFCCNPGNDAGDPYPLKTVSGATPDAFAGFPIPRKSLFGTFQGDGHVRCEDVRKDARFVWDPEPDGSFRVVSCLAVPVVTRSGDVLGALFFAHGDVGHFTEVHERLVLGIAAQASIALENARLYAQLRTSEANARNASAAAREAERRKDEFLAMLGHELRNPLAPIVTALELMRMRGAAGREAQIIERQIGHLVRLVDDLLDVARITRGKIELKRQRVEMAHVVARALEIAGPLIEQRGHHMEVDVPRGLPLFGDPTRLAQVISNLLANSAKYTDRGGHIAVRGWMDGESVALSVADDGTGIEPSVLPSIFEAFVQSPQASDRAQGGLGIGLTLVRSLLAMHGGRVEARSEGAGLGSEFVVRLPVAAEPVAISERPPRVGADPSAEPHGKLRVLVVDDNADAAEMLCEALRELGHDVFTAEDGPSALRVAETFHPDIAVLDIGLPVMDGYELAARLLQLDRAPAGLIAVTGYGQPEDRARGISAGFDAHLVKPVDLSALEQAIEATQRQAALAQ